MRSLEFTVSGLVDPEDPQTPDYTVNSNFNVEELDDGTLRVTVTFDESDGYIGDLRAVFFDFEDDSLLDGISITGDNVTDYEILAEDVSKIGKAKISPKVIREFGAFDVGVEIGTKGWKDDDIQSTSFIISHDSMDLSIDELNWKDFAVLVNNIGTADGERDDDLSVGLTATAAPDALDDELALTEDQTSADVSGTEGYPNLLTNDMLDWIDPGDDYMVETVDGVAANVGIPITVTSADGIETQMTVYADGTVVFDPMVDFNHLAVGETDTITLAYGIYDNNGGRDAAAMTVTVTGTNDGPVIDVGASTLTGGVAEIADQAPGENIDDLTASGDIAFSDVDMTDTHVASVAAQGVDYFGTFTLSPPTTTSATTTGSVGWSFTVNDADIDDLAQDEVLTQVYDVTIDDGNGSTAIETVTITITGSYDGPDFVTWVGTDGNDNFFGLEGNMKLYGLDGYDNLYGDYYALYSNYGGSRWYVDNQDLGGYFLESAFTPDFGNDLIDAGPGGGYVYGDARYLELKSLYGDHAVETGADTIYGNSGNDTLYGEGQMTYAYASSGFDSTVIAGADTIEGGSGVDRIYGEAHDFYAESYLDAGQTGSVALVEGGDDFLYGGADGDTLYGEGFYVNAISRNYATTGAQSATLYAGDDTIYGDGGNDTVFGDGYFLNARNASSSSVTSDQTVVAGNDELYGGDGVDTVYGDGQYGQAVSSAPNGASTVIAGDDIINGGAGDDLLWGDFEMISVYGTGNRAVITGADVFVFAPDCGVDTVHDFELNQDKLDVSAFDWADYDAMIGAGVTVTADGDDTIIDLDGAPAADDAGILLLNVSPDDVDAFIFDF